MLKFLRKYKNYLLVVGGSLLMIAFLLPQTFDQMSRSNFGVAMMRIDGEKVGVEDYSQSQREYYAVKGIVGVENGEMFNQFFFGGQSVEHWILLTREADEAGLVGGRADGEALVPLLARGKVMTSQFAQYLGADQLEQMIQGEAASMTAKIDQLGMDEHVRMQPEDVYRALSKLHGVMRLRTAYVRAGRYSDRRLASGFKRLSDEAAVSYVVVPPERAMESVPEPTDEEIAAHFEKYRDVRAEDDEFGIGYRLADRVKLEWMKIDRAAIAAAVYIDPVEVQKRFLKAYPTQQPPAGQSVQQVKERFEAEIRQEQAARAMKAAQQAVRSEIDRALRHTDADGEYRKLPEDWAAHQPDFAHVRDVVAARVKEMTGSEIVAPEVFGREAGWLGRQEMIALEGVGGSTLRRGNLSQAFADYVLSARELAGPNDTVLQVGIPPAEPTTDAAGNLYYFVILEARKKSPPDSVDEVRELVVTNMKKLAAYEVLKSQAEELRAQAAAGGLEALNAPVEGQDSRIKVTETLEIKTARVRDVGVSPADEAVDTEEFRGAVLDAAEKLDPTQAVEMVDARQRTVAVPLPGSLGVAVARITGVSPLTVEMYRTGQSAAVNQLQRDEMELSEDDPFSLKNLEARLKVTYRGGNEDEAQTPPTVPAS